MKLKLVFFTYIFTVQFWKLEADQQRPIYNIAHMVNTIKELDTYLDKGANSIEVDVQFTTNGSLHSTYHGFPCDCFRICDNREDFIEYIKYVRNISSPGSSDYKENFVLLFLDLKSSSLAPQHKYTAGTNLAKALIDHLWNRGDDVTPINILFSIGHTGDSDIVRGFMDTLKIENLEHLTDKIGWDVGLNDALLSIQRMWKNLNIKKNIWQGDGINNCLATFRTRGRLRNALTMRDSLSKINKVYQWTVDYSAFFRRSLREGVDAFITNFPERLNRVLLEPEYSRQFRLATIEDDPWERVDIRHPTDMELLSRTSLVSNVFNTVYEMFNSAMTFAVDFTRNKSYMSLSRISASSIVSGLADQLNRNATRGQKVASFCQHTVCTVLHRYYNQDDDDDYDDDDDDDTEFDSDTKCRNGGSSIGKEIKKICISLVHYLKLP
ncbi:phospholipase D SpeSicTox-betaIB4-like [Centruroides sculpturatus]|uniref:phospholipase D SpeSicTox-betaIB4-like n=1 Tax=Centruroides sculpturatus TaxID=218467 RepID=UPI000C6D27E6|nr:phospholipase D SpeSicTox-betaIB4-like [Centruroides sculpturatus]